MKKFSKKGILLFAGAMALCAFVLPSVASAASWGVVGTHHTLDSPNIGFTSGLGGGSTSSCTRSSFTSRVGSAAALEITAGTFGGLCTLNTAGAGRCTASPVGSKFPWTATAISTSDIRLDGVHISVPLSNIPGEAATCAGAGVTLTITGSTTSGGTWTGNGAGQHSLDLNNAEGLISVSALGNGPITARGFISDTQQTLVVN